MGFDYALVHLKYTIPPAVALTLLYRPCFKRIDLYKLLFLISIAVVATIPWDSYLIRRKVWTYPPDAVLGPTLFLIPAEELFFFVIQTYNTTFLYFFLSKPVLHSRYLKGRINAYVPVGYELQRNVGLAVLGISILLGGLLVWKSGETTYLGLILAWATPFALLLWCLSYQFLVGLPISNTILSIALPTLYLWVIDTIALRRGTWAIESGTKLGIHVWDGLEVEEAIFFLATNILIVFGLVSFDNALAILLTFPHLFPKVPELPSPVLLVRALLIDTSNYDVNRIRGIREAADRLQRKSRSFFLASAVFGGRLRIDLILLYSFCRVADDLVDDSSSESEAREWIFKLTEYLDLTYASKESKLVSNQPAVQSYITTNFPTSAQSALRLLPTHLLSFRPLYDLLDGFRTDLNFRAGESSKDLQFFPIEDDNELEVYAARVAGTVAELCLELVFHHTSSPTTANEREHLIRCGAKMGVALQYVNISRDIVTDAKIGRVYLPTNWLREEGLKPQDVLEDPQGPAIEKLRAKLLTKAFGEYKNAHHALEQLPADARGPMRVAVESYMEIGRVLREKGYCIKEGKATVPKSRRLKVAWKALNEG